VADCGQFWGGKSGKDMDKESLCDDMGFDMGMFGSEISLDSPLLCTLCLPREVEQWMEGGSHDLAVYQVTHMYTGSVDETLSTAQLRALGHYYRTGTHCRRALVNDTSMSLQKEKKDKDCCTC